jgi:hypothetical protein
MYHERKPFANWACARRGSLAALSEAPALRKI